MTKSKRPNDELEMSLDAQITEKSDKSLNVGMPKELPEQYKPVSQLTVPQKAVDHFKAQGYSLQWVRIKEPGAHGALDLKNIQKKEMEGYTFVPRSEIPGIRESMTSFFQDQMADSSHGLYVIGDLALAKFPLDKAKAKRKYNEARVRERSKAIIDDLRKNSVMPSREHGEGISTVRDAPRARSTNFGGEDDE